MADLDFVGVIKRCKAVLLVAQALPAVARLDPQACCFGEVEVPEAARRMVAFMRVWCLGESSSFHRTSCQYLRCWETGASLMLTAACVMRCTVELMASRDNKIPVVMRCGTGKWDTSTGSHRFVDDNFSLRNLEWLVDVTAAEAADPADKAHILGQISVAEGGAAGLSSDISGWVSGAVTAAAEAHAEANFGGGAAAESVSRTATAAVQAAMCGEPEQLAELPTEKLAAAVRVAAALGADVALAGLLGRGAPVDEPNYDGFTALMVAARAGWAGAVEVLVGNGWKSTRR